MKIVIRTKNILICLLLSEKWRKNCTNILIAYIVDIRFFAHMAVKNQFNTAVLRQIMSWTLNNDTYKPSIWPNCKHYLLYHCADLLYHIHVISQSQYVTSPPCLCVIINLAWVLYFNIILYGSFYISFSFGNYICFSAWYFTTDISIWLCFLLCQYVISLYEVCYFSIPNMLFH